MIYLLLFFKKRTTNNQFRLFKHHLYIFLKTELFKHFLKIPISISNFARLAKLVRRCTCNAKITSSNLVVGINFFFVFLIHYHVSTMAIFNIYHHQKKKKYKKLYKTPSRSKYNNYFRFIAI